MGKVLLNILLRRKLTVPLVGAYLLASSVGWFTERAFADQSNFTVSFTKIAKLEYKYFEFNLKLENMSDLSLCFDWWEGSTFAIRFRNKDGSLILSSDDVPGPGYDPLKDDYPKHFEQRKIAPWSTVMLMARKRVYRSGAFMDDRGFVRRYQEGEPLVPQVELLLYDCANENQFDAAYKRGFFEVISAFESTVVVR